MRDGSARLIVPALGGVYRVFAPYTETAIRIVAGLSFVPHGYPKLFFNPMARRRSSSRVATAPGCSGLFCLGVRKCSAASCWRPAS